MSNDNPYLAYVTPRDDSGAPALPRDEQGRYICQLPFMPFQFRFSLPTDGRMGFGMYTANGIELCGRECTFADGAFSFEQSLPIGECFFQFSLNHDENDRPESLGIIFELYTGLNKDEPVVQIPINIPLAASA